LPFWCDISIGYIATDKVLGLSKFARIAHKHAHKLQIQERLIHEIANEIKEITGTQDVAVYSEGVHLCMIMRGIKTNGVLRTSALAGRFREYQKVREEFFAILERDRSKL
jgi:GTP cyclohydrolase I